MYCGEEFTGRIRLRPDGLRARTVRAAVSMESCGLMRIQMNDSIGLWKREVDGDNATLWTSLYASHEYTELSDLFEYLIEPFEDSELLITLVESRLNLIRALRECHESPEEFLLNGLLERIG